MPERLPLTRRWFRTLCAIALTLALAGPSWAIGGTQHIPNGLSDFLGGVLPPPGFYWLNYLAYVQKNEFEFEDKSDIERLAGDIDLDASAIVEAARFVYMSPHKILGATWGAQIIFPFYRAHAKLDVGEVEAFDSRSSGIGDITINPLILAWHFTPNFHMGFGIDIVVPTGPYNQDEPASQILNKNHWTFEPLVAISYWVPGGIDVSAKIMYDFHTKNDKFVVDPFTSFSTNGEVSPGKEKTLKPGQEFHVDWGVSYAIAKEDLRVGLAGYYYQQTTDDEVGDVEVDSSFRSRIAAIGPALKWWPGMGRFSVTAKWMKEFAAENEKEGQTFWVNTVYAF